MFVDTIFREPPLNCKFFLKHVKLLKSTGWPHVIRSQFFTQDAQVLIIIKAFSFMFMSFKISKSLNHFSHGMHHSVHH